MPEEPFMLVSLKEDKAKKLANVLSNETASKLLNHLAKKGEDSETAIAKALKLPLSTVHYNLKQLVAAKLVTANEYHYSEKGREILHYKLANKYIIIAPAEEQEGFLDKLKQFLPIGLITLGTAVVLKLLGLVNGTTTLRTSQLHRESVPAAANIPQPSAMMDETAKSIGGNTGARLPLDTPEVASAAEIPPTDLDAVADVRGLGSEMVETPPNDLQAIAEMTEFGGEMRAEIVENITNETLTGTGNETLQNVTIEHIVEREIIFIEQTKNFFSNEMIIAFLVGAAFVIALFVIFSLFQKEKKK